MSAPTPQPRPAHSRILFVCMGNICRSPLAEGIFAHLAGARGVRSNFTIDSCGTGGWHAGEPPDPRTLAIASRYGVPLDHAARQLSPADFDRFDLLLAMDRDNLRGLNSIRANCPRVRLIRQFDPAFAPTTPGADVSAPDVPDPYYGGAEGFDRMYHMLHTACTGLLDALLRRCPVHFPDGGTRGVGREA